jgi:2-keto-3-deoxy-galactonokinase
LIASSLPEVWPNELNPTVVELGNREAEQGGLGRVAFLVRISQLLQTLEPHDRASLWIGAVVGDDARHFARHAILSDNSECDVWVGGRQPLRSAFVHFLGRLHKGRVRALEDKTAGAASALGACRVARRWFQLKSEAVS